MIKSFTSFIVLLILASGCKPKIKQTDDSVYSRHLQRHVKLSILNTPAPEDRNSFNLLLLNGAKDFDGLKVRSAVDSLYEKKLIQPLVVVTIYSDKPSDEYGVVGMTDQYAKDAEKYSSFIDDELYPFVKKKTGVRKFNSITIAGSESAGLAAFDIAWEHADRIDKAGIFSGAFGITGNSSATHDNENRIIFNKILSSKKRPRSQFWFYTGDTSNIQKDTKDLISLLQTKNIPSSNIIYIDEKQGTNDHNYWSHLFPEFLIWAVGK